MNWPAIQTLLQTWCEQHSELLAVYLFGSQAEGRAAQRSDVDLALLARPDICLTHPCGGGKTGGPVICPVCWPPTALPTYLS